MGTTFQKSFGKETYLEANENESTLFQEFKARVWVIPNHHRNGFLAFIVKTWVLKEPEHCQHWNHLEEQSLHSLCRFLPSSSCNDLWLSRNATRFSNSSIRFKRTEKLCPEGTCSTDTCTTICPSGISFGVGASLWNKSANCSMR